MIELNNTLFRLLKEINQNVRTNQLEIINEIRHFVQDLEKQVAIFEEKQKKLNLYPYLYKGNNPKEPF